MAKDSIITSVEIGSSRIKICMGEINDDDELELLAFEEIDTEDYVRKGEIIQVNPLLELFNNF